MNADPQAGPFCQTANRTLVDEVSRRLHRDALVGPMSQYKLETFASRSINIALATGLGELAVGHHKFRGTRDTPGMRALSAQMNSTVYAGEAKIFLEGFPIDLMLYYLSNSIITSKSPVLVKF